MPKKKGFYPWLRKAGPLQRQLHWKPVNDPFDDEANDVPTLSDFQRLYGLMKEGVELGYIRQDLVSLGRVRWLEIVDAEFVSPYWDDEQREKRPYADIKTVVERAELAWRREDDMIEVTTYQTRDLYGQEYPFATHDETKLFSTVEDAVRWIEGVSLCVLTRESDEAQPDSDMDDKAVEEAE